MSVLVARGRLRFAAARDLTGLSEGNLASHLAALSKAGYVDQRNAIILKRPGKIIELTTRGRSAFWTYFQALEELVAGLRQLRTVPNAVAGPESSSDDSASKGGPAQGNASPAT